MTHVLRSTLADKYPETVKNLMEKGFFNFAYAMARFKSGGAMCRMLGRAGLSHITSGSYLPKPEDEHACKELLAAYPGDSILDNLFAIGSTPILMRDDKVDEPEPPKIITSGTVPASEIKVDGGDLLLILVPASVSAKLRRVMDVLGVEVID